MPDETVTVDLTGAFAAADRASLVLRSRPVRTVEDADAVQTFVDALAHVQEGWGVPELGVPICPVRVDLYDGTELVGHVAVSEHVLVAHVHGTFLARTSSPSVSRTLLAVLRADDLLDDEDRPFSLDPP